MYHASTRNYVDVLTKWSEQTAFYSYCLKNTHNFLMFLCGTRSASGLSSPLSEGGSGFFSADLFRGALLISNHKFLNFLATTLLSNHKFLNFLATTLFVMLLGSNSITSEHGIC